MEDCSLSRMRQRAALVKASIAFLIQWEIEGGRGLVEAKQALLAVFQFDPPILVERALTLWRDPFSDRRKVTQVNRQAKMCVR